MRKFKFGIPLLGAIAIAFGLSNCADESHWGNSSKEKGSISLTLSADTGIKTAKPMFRSEDGESAADPNNLATYINVPSIDDFSIKLEKSTGEVTSWSTLTDFKDYIAKNQFDTGTYTLTAYSGVKGKQDFEAPYFEASTTFNVLSDQENEINLTAELQNSMVKINYTDAFKEYMKDFHAKIKTDGIGEPITYGNIETRPLFIEPKNANISLHFTTKGREYTSEIVLGDFPPMAKTLHNITFDLSENASSEEATLEIKFDETLEEEPIIIDLTIELLTNPAPTIACTGFENGQTLDMLEFGNDVPQILMKASASDQIESAIMTIESDNYTPSWGKEIDLCKATSEQQAAIEASGIKAQGFGFNGTGIDLMATLELTNFGKNLVKGNHKVSLVVKDIKGKTSQSTSVVFDNQDIILELIGSPTFVYAAERGELTFDFNGTNPLENVQFSVDGQRVNTISCSEQPATRAAEKKTYTFTLPINNPIKPNVKVTASYKGEKNLGEFTTPVNIPEYKIEAYDAFSRYAYAKITTTDPAMLSAVTENIRLKDLNIAQRDPSTGILTITGLTPATAFSVKSSITGDTPADDNGSFTTETELQIPNGDFETEGSVLKSETLLVGGDWYATNTVFTKPNQHYSSFYYSLPDSWYTINELTAPSKDQVSNYNTWYVVPSSWLENGKGLMRNVGYSHNGKVLGDPKGTNTDHYCRDHPSNNDLDKVPGVLSLGKYDYINHTAEGIDFSSRPSYISFDYEYNNDQSLVKDEFKDDKGYAYIEILDTKNNVLGSKEFELTQGVNTENITFNYGAFEFEGKAAKLKVVFKSSKNAVPPIHIPTGSELSEGDNKAFDISNKTFPANQYHAVATGSILKIDNVKAHYGDAPGVSQANAPKRKTNKR